MVIWQCNPISVCKWTQSLLLLYRLALPGFVRYQRLATLFHDCFPCALLLPLPGCTCRSFRLPKFAHLFWWSWTKPGTHAFSTNSATFFVVVCFVTLSALFTFRPAILSDAQCGKDDVVDDALLTENGSEIPRITITLIIDVFVCGFGFVCSFWLKAKKKWLVKKIARLCVQHRKWSARRRAFTVKG